MFGFLTAIPGLLSGLFTTVNGVTAAISNEKIALINATTDRERNEIQERISALQATASALAAESAKSSIPMFVQLLMTLPWALYMLKVVVWDKMLQWGSTDTLSPQEWYLCYVVYGFWFVHSIVGVAKS
jgi:hypothetical protein